MGRKKPGLKRDKLHKGSIKQKSGVKSTGIVKHPANHEEDIDISNGDIEYFGENSAFTRFLGKINEQELSKNITKSRNQSQVPRLPNNCDSSRKGGEWDSEIEDSLQSNSSPVFSNTDQTCLVEADVDIPSVNPESVEKAQTRRVDWDLEQDYETAPRIHKQKPSLETSNRLPIKLRNGYLQLVKGSETILDPEEESTKEQETQSDQSSKQFVNNNIDEAKETLANLASLLIENPEENISNLRKLRDVYIAGNGPIRILALLTQLAVFRDIIPGYRLRPQTEEEKKIKLSKDVKRLRIFEETLLGGYKLYVDELKRIVTEARRNLELFSGSGVNVVAVECICQLLVSVPHFNFRSELLGITVAILSRQTIDQAFIKCRNSMEEMLKNDQDGMASSEAVRVLAKMIKDKAYHIHQKTLDLFLCIRLLNDLDRNPSEQVELKAKQKRKEREHRTRKARKLEKERILIEKELKEAEASVNIEQLSQLQNEILKLVFTTYLNILKHGRSELIAPVLEGLAKFSHLINMDLFADILEVFKDILHETESGETIQTRNILLCIATSFAILNGQRETKLNLDLSQFTAQFYKILLPLSLNPNIESKLDNGNCDDVRVNVATETDMMIRCFEAIFLKRKSIPITRGAAFVKRLLITSLHTPEKSSKAILDMLSKLIRLHPRLQALFTVDEVVGTGIFKGHTDDPETSNPFASVAWETYILRSHYSPRVRNAVASLFESTH